MATPFSTNVHSRLGKSAVTLAIVAVASLSLSTSASAVEPTVDLGTASTFAVLAGAGITNSGSTTADGNAGSDFGSEPSPAFSGITDVTTSGGTKFSVVDAQVELAQDDSTAAYLDAASRTSSSTISNITGQTFVPGVYGSESTIVLDVNGTVTLNAQGNPDAVFIFQAGSDLIMSVGSRVQLENSADACNVFWQVTSSATIGSSSRFAGHVLALASITVGTRAIIEGSLLAQTGSVTLLQNAFHNNQCRDSGAGGGGSGSGGSGGSASGGNGTTEGLALTGSNGAAMPLVLGFGVTAFLAAALVARRRRRT